MINTNINTILNINNIAQEIFDIASLYNWIKNNNIAWACGFNSPKNYKNKVLVFKVQWFILKGFVFISLSPLDLFNITFTNTRKKIINQVEWIYIDQLLKIIDNNVEKPNNQTDKQYKEKVMQDFNDKLLT